MMCWWWCGSRAGSDTWVLTYRTAARGTDTCMSGAARPTAYGICAHSYAPLDMFAHVCALLLLLCMHVFVHGFLMLPRLSVASVCIAVMVRKHLI